MMTTMSQTNWISATKAAEMLGVSRQTVMNWAEKGVVRRRKQKSGKGVVYAFDHAQLEALKGDLLRVHETELSIAEYESQVKAAQEKCKQKAVDTHELLKMYEQFPELTEALNRFFMKVTKASCNVDARELDILDLMLCRKPAHVIAEQYGISTERIKQIFGRTIAKLTEELRTRTDDWENYQHMVCEIDRLNDVVEYYKRALAEKDAPVAEEDLLCKRCRDCGFSVRTMNVILGAELVTLGDVLNYGKEKLLKSRNFGQRSLAELEEFFEKNGLEFK